MTPAASHCPVSGCTTAINTLRFVMCGRHWSMVPRALAAEVYRSWDVRQRQPGDPSSAHNHERAKKAAIKAVDDLLARQVPRRRLP